MDEAEWNAAVARLISAADRLDTLSRCLRVTPQLEEWRASGDELAGGDAANALDQARGDLEWLGSDRLTDLVETVASLLDVLPPPWD